MSLPRIAKKVASSRSRSRKLVLSPLARRRLRAMGFVDDKHDWMMHGIGKELGTVNHEVLAPCSEPVTSASGFELVCSYNWIVRGDQGQPLRIRAPAWSGQPRPQIVVPGQAARLIPHRLPLRTSHHSRGQTFRDANVARSPRWPFEPMFRAAEVMRPDFKFDDVDVVINRNSLSILLKMGACLAQDWVFFLRLHPLVISSLPSLPSRSLLRTDVLDSAWDVQRSLSSGSCHGPKHSHCDALVGGHHRCEP